jgi:SWI/SNF-related matrix-associated actin-dependent regulator of chromatin subfamily A3
MRALKFHGNDRKSLEADIDTADIVLTTYNTLTRDFQRKDESSTLHRFDWRRIVLDEGTTLAMVLLDQVDRLC